MIEFIRGLWLWIRKKLFGRKITLGQLSRRQRKLVHMPLGTRLYEISAYGETFFVRGAHGQRINPGKAYS